MSQFLCFLNEVVLKECHLNGRSHPTLECIDWVFISNEWEALFPHSFLHSLLSLCSDHAPLLLNMDDTLVAKKRFHFCSFWVHALGFLDVVARAWMLNRDVNMIYRAEDKNNDRLNRRLVPPVAQRSYAQRVSSQLKVVHMEQCEVAPNIISNEWEALFPNSFLH
jgi:hypothetical protein